MVQRILDSVENAAARKPKIDRFITVSPAFTPLAVVAIALLTAIIPSLVTGEWHKWVYTRDDLPCNLPARAHWCSAYR